MKSNVKKVIAVGAGTTLALGDIAGTALTAGPQDAQPAPSPAAAVNMVDASVFRGSPLFRATSRSPRARWTPSRPSPVPSAMVSKHLCGSSFQETDNVSAAEWVITVGGAVEHR